LFVTPEYNRSIPGVLKSVLDHASRPYGQNAWAGKPAGLLGASIGAVGTAVAQQHLRNVLAYLDVPAMGQPEAFVHAKEGFFDSSGKLNRRSCEFLQAWMDAYVEWVKRHTSVDTRQRPSGRDGAAGVAFDIAIAGCHGRDGECGVMTGTIAPAVTLLLPYPIALQQRRPGPPTCRQDRSLHVGCCHASCRVDRTLERDHAVLAA
jgi:hypothetical protein